MERENGQLFLNAETGRDVVPGVTRQGLAGRALPYCALERTFLEAGNHEKCTCRYSDVTFMLPIVRACESLWGTPSRHDYVEPELVPPDY
jgi:hypothetical protein